MGNNLKTIAGIAILIFFYNRFKKKKKVTQDIRINDWLVPNGEPVRVRTSTEIWNGEGDWGVDNNYYPLGCLANDPQYGKESLVQGDRLIGRYVGEELDQNGETWYKIIFTGLNNLCNDDTTAYTAAEDLETVNWYCNGGDDNNTVWVNACEKTFDDICGYGPNVDFICGAYIKKYQENGSGKLAVKVFN